MPIRRTAAPKSVQHIWDAIKFAVVQRQMADSKRIVKYLQRMEKCTYAQAELSIQQALKDGMIVALQKVTKSSKGDMIDSYRIPTQELPELDGKDWYCFECHSAGNVITCKNCWRVYHADCIANGRRKFDEYKKTNNFYDSHNKLFIKTDESTNSINISSESDDLNASTNGLSTYNKSPLNNNEGNEEFYDETVCSVCNIAKIDTKCQLDRTELNYLLRFVIQRIQSWLPNTITHTMASEPRPEWMNDKELSWRANQLFFEHRDMSVIEGNLNNEYYTQIDQFLADILTIQHNVAIFHGIESQEFGAAELMLRDCMHDLTELRLCIDCYRHSNEKINAKWFCLPCRVPHRLVWAKQKGYPYWPAKVIHETSTHFDVRFFGGKYERSLLAKSFIKPIETPQSKLQIKASSAFNKSVEELRFHQKLLNNPEELENLIKLSKSRAASKQNIKKINSDLNNMKNPFDVNDVYKFEDAPQQNFTLHQHKRKNSFHEENPQNKKKAEGEEIKNTSDTVIHISDGDEEEEYSFRDNFNHLNFNGSYEQVSSSTEQENKNQENGMQQLDHPYSDSVERMRRRLEGLDDKKEIIKCAMECMQGEIDKITNEHNDHLKKLFEAHNAQISETKKKQWCYNCEQDAIYHCCWNTAYCSQSCQQQHWQAEHKKVCRRSKR